MERFDFSYAPYDVLDTLERNILQSSVNIVFFHDDEVVIQPETPIDTLYVVLKGMIKEISSDGEVVTLYHPKDTFDTRAVLEGISHNQFIVAEQALLYAIPKTTVLRLIESNVQFATYFYANITEKFSSILGQKTEQELAGLFVAKVKDAYRGNTLWIEGQQRISETAQSMKKHRVKSVLVKHEDKIGVLTESVFRDILIQGASADDPAHQWASYNLIGVDIQDYVFNALLKMMQYKIQRLVVEQDGQPIGTLEQIDILAYVSNHSHLLAERLENADSIEELENVAQQMNNVIQGLHNNGMRAMQLAQLMKVLNKSLIEKAWNFVAPAELIENSCLIVMGSEGRGEQVLKTDQDNALILRPNADLHMAEQATEQLAQLLERLGYPPCAGKIMANNPDWRKPLPEFKKMVVSWCTRPDPTSMMNLAIFMDARAIVGDVSLLEEVKTHLNNFLTDDAGMMMMFARAVDQFQEQTQGFFAQLLGRERNKTMDVKKMGLFPIVHGIRSLSIEAKLEETNTFERIQKLVALNKLDKQLGQDISEALAYFMDLRLKFNIRYVKNNQAIIPNQVEVHNLSTLERDLLKDALKVVKDFKQMIRLHFHLTNM